jgi:hypothetical protein
MTVTPRPAPPVEPHLLQIGDIGVTRSWVVTPWGYAPLARSEWFVVDRTAWTQAIPVWAIVLAILFFPLGLLFLLVKETRATGWLEVTVRSGTLVHQVAIPAGTVAAAGVHPQVAYARHLAGVAAAAS